MGTNRVPLVVDVFVLCYEIGIRRSLAKNNNNRMTLLTPSILLSSYLFNFTQLSLVVRKPAFCICENKDADQLRSNCTADQRLCSVTAKLIRAFVLAIRIVQSRYYLNPKFQASSHLLWFVLGLVGNPEDRFSYNEAQFKVIIIIP